MKGIDQSKYLPPYFTEDDILEYEMLLAESKRLFPCLKHDYIYHVAIIHHIEEKKGLIGPLDDSVANKIMESCLKSEKLDEYTTPYDPDFDMQSTMKEVVMIETTAN
jgi:hypothetical protein